jgi:microcompartment protein CcmK/EutM
MEFLASRFAVCCWGRARSAGFSAGATVVEFRLAAGAFALLILRFGSYENVMILARIVGTVVSTRKDARLEGKKLLIVKPISPEGADESGYLVAVDTVSSGFRETVLVVTGSSARNATECKDRPVDAAIIGIVDEVKLDALHEAELAAARKKSE